MNNIKLTLGSLFDGSGGFPLAAYIVGFNPVWASEVEPVPIRVTTQRIPNMAHLGDISKINGAEISPVDIITFGSPCQDLSIAGSRKGLKGNKSGLFHEAIRIIKEMKAATNGEKPKFIIWENVTGAFSSNKGEDFKTVIEELLSVTNSYMDVPRPTKWQPAGEVVGSNFSIVWRTFNAQYWGVPQRRRRIYLIMDTRGRNAAKILFESKNVCFDFTEGRKKQYQNTSNIKGSITEPIICLADQGGKRMDLYTNKSGTLLTHQVPVVYDVRLTTLNTKNARHNIYETDTSRTLSTGTNSPADNQGGLAICNRKTVRRLTPKECGRLQGFPDYWTESLTIENPTKEEINFWTEKRKNRKANY